MIGREMGGCVWDFGGQCLALEAVEAGDEGGEVVDDGGGAAFSGGSGGRGGGGEDGGDLLLGESVVGAGGGPEGLQGHAHQLVLEPHRLHRARLSPRRRRRRRRDGRRRRWRVDGHLHLSFFFSFLSLCCDSHRERGGRGCGFAGE